MVGVNRNNLLLNPTRSSPGPVVKVLEKPKIPLLLWAWSKGDGSGADQPGPSGLVNACVLQRSSSTLAWMVQSLVG